MIYSIFSDLANNWSGILEALLQTFVMVGIAIIIAILIGLPLGTILALSSKKQLYESPPAKIGISVIVNTIRSIPFLLLVIVLLPFTRFLVGTSFGSLAASIPLSFVAIALFTRAVEQTVLEVPKNVIESALAMGAKRYQVVFHFIYTEARSGLVLALTSTIIGVLSFSTILGVVGGGGIGDFAVYYGYVRNQYGLMLVVIMLMVFIVQVIQFLGSFIAKSIDKKRI